MCRLAQPSRLSHAAAVLHEQPSDTKKELLRSSEGGYFGPGNTQLPAPPMLMMDRVTETSLDGGEFGKGHIVGELDIAPGHWFFDCNFRGQ
jgi:3-hydroxyacyl-[acyl-carrier protein] dehydratase/trans-2-decenoyl-[acyl-carrier protein] isomerase